MKKSKNQFQVKTFCCLIPCIAITLSSFSQFEMIKNDTSIKAVKTSHKSYPGITEIKPNKVFFKAGDAELFHHGEYGYKLVFSWWSLSKNGMEEIVILFNKSDIKDLVNILDLTLSRTDDCEYKNKKFHIGRLGSRLIFFHGGGYANISNVEGKQLENFLKSIES
jgi:hypothetical protein